MDAATSKSKPLGQRRSFRTARFVVLLMTGLGLWSILRAAHARETNLCDVAWDRKACLTTCANDEDCRITWLEAEVGQARIKLKRALNATDDFDGTCRRAYVPSRCTRLCPDKTRLCALAVLKMEADDHARVASVMRHLKRLADKEASAPTEEALKLFDPRTPVDRVAHPEYEPIGLVETLEVRRDLGGFGRGSGWLTSDCLVVTAQHLFDPDKPVIGTAVKFLVGSPPTENDNFRFKTTGKVVATGKSLREDWALVRLDRSLGKQVGKIKTWQYSVDDAKSCVALETAGYPGEKPVDKLWWQTACHLDAELSSPGNFEIDCPVTHGQSGGPLLCRETNGELRAIGLIKSQGFGVYLHAVNFTFDWQNAIKPALQKFARDCPAN